MRKPEAVEIPSDDCVLTIGGVTFAPHEGEAVWVRPGMTVGELRLLREIQGLQVKIAALADEDEDGVRRIAAMDDAFGSAVAFLRDRLVRWTWTDDAGAPYAQPRDDPAILERLRIEEIFYLVGAVNGANPGQQKNVSRPSQIMSWDTAPALSRT